VTSIVYKKLIAEYAGIPIGNELKKLRARNNLAISGFHFGLSIC